MKDATGGGVYDPEFRVASAEEGKVYFLTVDRANEFNYKTEISENYENVKKNKYPLRIS